MSRLLEKVKATLEADEAHTGGKDDEIQSINQNTVNSDTDQCKTLTEDKGNGVNSTNKSDNMLNEAINNNRRVTEKLSDADTEQLKVLIDDDKKTKDLEMFADVIDKFTVDELKKLIVKNKHDEDVLFCDTGNLFYLSVVLL